MEPRLGHNFSGIPVHSDSRKDSFPSHKLSEDDKSDIKADSCSLKLVSPMFCPFGGTCHSCPLITDVNRLASQRHLDRRNSEEGEVFRTYVPRDLVSQTIQGLSKSVNISQKLETAQLGDIYEEEADRVAHTILKTSKPQFSNQPDEEERLHPKPLVAQISRAHGGLISHADIGLEAQIQSLRGWGQPLPRSLRNFFEPRFGYDFSPVRIHTDNLAAETARELNAYAFTVGNDIAFASGQYAPRMSAGQNLLAHELTHVVQQNTIGESAIQRRAKRRRKRFNFEKSRIRKKIIEDWQSWEKITFTSDDPQKKPKAPVDINEVLALLPLSESFLKIAKSVENMYFPARGGPLLKFEFHMGKEGTKFERRKPISKITIEVDNLANVVARIAHEVTHASHGALKPVGKRIGSVARAEREAIKEERQTRITEKKILSEIRSKEVSKEHLRGAKFPETKTESSEVRKDFVSWLPKLTYQEFFIIEELKKDNRVEGVNEEDVRRIAVDMRSAHFKATAVDKSTVPQFRVKVEQHRKGMREEIPPEPITNVKEAMSCLSTRKGDTPSCKHLLRYWSATIPIPQSPREQEAQYYPILIDWQNKRDLAKERRDASTDFIRWYDRVKGDKKKALEFFEWVLIEEAMSREWENKGKWDKETRDRHLDFLERRASRGLRGIPRP